MPNQADFPPPEVTPRSPRSGLEIYQRRDGTFGWRQRAGNSRIIASGEGYSRRRDAVRGATRAVPGVPVKS